MSERKWEACPPRGQWDWTVFGPDGMAALVHTGEADAKRFAASAALLEACEAVLVSVEEEIDLVGPSPRLLLQRNTLRAAIRVVREG